MPKGKSFEGWLFVFVRRRVVQAPPQGAGTEQDADRREGHTIRTDDDTYHYGPPGGGPYAQILPETAA